MLQKNKQFANLCQKGIGQELYNKYSIIFMDSIAIREYAYTPSSGALPDDIRVEENANVSIGNNIEEDFDEYLDSIVSTGSILGGSPSQTSFVDASEKATRKQKRNEGITNYTPRKKNKQQSGVAQLSNTIRELKDDMKENVEKRISIMCSVLGDRPGCFISEVMEDVLSLPNMTVGSQLHFFSTLF